MATYKGIQGYTVQSLSSDPTASSDTEGQLWYTSDGGKFKIAVSATGAWSAGGTFNKTDAWLTGTCGTQTAGLAATGYPPSLGGATEEYDGTSWAEVGAVNAGRYGNGGAGSATAGLTFAGALHSDPSTYTGATELYNGTAWTEVGDMTTGRHYVASTNYAPATACLCMGGAAPASVSNVESYNGTAWTELTDFNTARAGNGGAGTTTSAITFGGYPIAANGALTESWNGSAWTEVGDLNTARTYTGAAGISNTAALCYSGRTPPSTSVVVNEKWNGTSWTEVADLTSGRQYPTSIGTSSLALAGGGAPGTSTEEWNDPVYSAKTVTVS